VSNFRSRALLDCAHKIQECQLQTPACIGHSEHGCEPAHANWSRYGKGGALKAHDCFYVAACHPCHAYLDQGMDLTREERLDYWQRGFERTVLALWERGLVRVA
jgi:hypothetical protein